MKTIILNEAGHDEALLGMSLSYYDHAEPIDDWWDEAKKLKAIKRSVLLAPKDGGHNKFLESITVWIYIQASRSFWQEFDTYRVGMTKQSASTMHTLDKRPVTEDDFEIGTSRYIIDAFNQVLAAYKNPTSPYFKDITYLKDNLPEGWLQERVVTTNYKVLRHIISQRENHRLLYWKLFCNEIKSQLKHKDLL
jgi:hypothetical protein